jgi:hypothetical protein
MDAGSPVAAFSWVVQDYLTRLQYLYGALAVLSEESLIGDSPTPSVGIPGELSLLRDHRENGQNCCEKFHRIRENAARGQAEGHNFTRNFLKPSALFLKN